MASLSALGTLLEHQTSPCVSLYQPIYRSPPERAQNAVRFANLVTQVGETLREHHPRQAAEGILASLTRLREGHDFLLPTSDGLAVFASPDFVSIRSFWKRGATNLASSTPWPDASHGTRQHQMICTTN